MRDAGRVLMVQGTMSHVGKSVLTAALCRVFAQGGLRVAPFKSQNMSLNSYATPDGGEIGRAQAVQAQASRAVPAVDMNPILLKPEGEGRSQVVVLGRPMDSVRAKRYYEMRAKLWPVVTGALDRLREAHDIVVIEGAGSPAEINLRSHEIVNMRVARYAEAPVILVGDIDRGGVFAALVGTLELLSPEERGLVRGHVINKFRGDLSILEPGLEMLREKTGLPTLGVLPFFTDISLPDEDSLGLQGEAERADSLLDVAVARLPHIANFDDFDPLKHEHGVQVRFVEKGPAVGSPDLAIIPGSKTTVADLRWLRESGLAKAFVELRQKGRPVIGICAGYQMLGASILDPDGIESDEAEVEGLRLLPGVTTFGRAKATAQVEGQVVAGRGLLSGCRGEPVTGYEIHMGTTEATGPPAPFLITRRSDASVDDLDGGIDAEGKVLGTYLHGLFHNHGLRRSMLRTLASWKGVKLPDQPSEANVDSELDKLAALVREHLDIAKVYEIAGLPRGL